MNFLKTTKIILLLAVTLVMSCSKDDDLATVSSPNVDYSFSSFFSTFFQEGSTDTPSVNWNGSQGSFALANTINGLSINTNSGVVSWTKVLSPGNHDIQVIASNSAGQSTSSFIIENTLQGLFVGNYNGTGYFNVDFSTDGTTLITADDASASPQFSGTWTRTNNEILVNFHDIIDPSSNQYSLKGELIQSNTDVIFAGTLYFDYDAMAGSEYYTYSVVLN